MALAQAIRQAMQARGLPAGAVTRRLGERRDYTTFFRLLNGRTTDPRVTTLVRVCAVLETSPSELLDLAGVWSAGTPGRTSVDDLRLRGAFARVRALPVARKRRAVLLVEALAGAWTAAEDPATEDAASSRSHGSSVQRRGVRLKGHD